MRVGVTGATGFVGRRVIETLRHRGDEVVAFSRDPSRAVTVLPGVAVQGLDALTPDGLSGLDGVVNLAGEPVAARRWSAEHKTAIHRSRVETTQRVVTAMGGAAPRPRVLVNASAVGYYGDRGDETVDETAGPGQGFLAEVCVAWEREAVRAEALGVRVVRLRIGVVLGEDGGALAQMARPFKLGVGGPLGDGRQYVPWVHVDDVVGLIVFALDDAQARGPFNVTAPEPLRSEAFAAAMGRAMRRPARFAVPRFALRIAVGEMSTVLLSGQRAVPRAAQQAGYIFRHTDAEEAVRAALGMP